MLSKVWLLLGLFIVNVVALQSCTTAKSVRVGSPPNSNPQSSFSVAWRTDSHEHCGNFVVEYGLAANHLSESAQISFSRIVDTGHLYQAHLKDLKADSEYFYRVGTPSEGYTSVYSARTAPLSTLDPATPRDFTILAWGDSRSNRQARRVLTKKARDLIDAEYSGRVDYSLHAGDIVSSGEVQSQWDNYFEDTVSINAYVRGYYAAGNHDVKGLDMSMFHNIPLPFKYDQEQYFSADYGITSVVVMSKEVIAGWRNLFARVNKLPWLRRTLDIFRADKRQSMWTIVCRHEPVWSSVPGRDGPPQKIFRYLFGRQFEGDVSLVVVGHNHYYARSYPLDASGNIDDSSDSDYGDITQDDKFIQVVAARAGVGSAHGRYVESPRVCKYSPYLNFAMLRTGFNATHTYMHVKAFGTDLKDGKTEYTDIEADYKDLEEIDNFRLIKKLPEKFLSGVSLPSRKPYKPGPFTLFVVVVFYLPIALVILVCACCIGYCRHRRKVRVAFRRLHRRVGSEIPDDDTVSIELEGGKKMSLGKYSEMANVASKGRL